MTIINAVECNDIHRVCHIATSYLESAGIKRICTDSQEVANCINSAFGRGSCNYGETLVALWLSARPGDCIIITKFYNVYSSIFESVKEQYPVLEINGVEVV